MTLLDIAYALAIVAALVLAIGGLRIWKADRTRALLMLGVSAVTLLNVWSWGSLDQEAAEAARRAAEAEERGVEP
ncbi:MAG: hypothetical protein ACK4Z0_05590 [Sphingomonadaceae bacterium]